ncbi:PP2C family protein-serine/threonine phosphatase [Paenibacillus turpanensis]|uniref:PP2C family protein-serine/threonine phosphatase n=1 Tax=Paenibacillus turpanensis TaxID=2689078 RepID=UPI00140A7E9A|nr:PP2C family protein-serine/threonine phosphatase [Paenibacillus turpanensis]
MIQHKIKQLSKKTIRLYFGAGTAILIFHMLQTIAVTSITIKEALQFHFPAQLLLITIESGALYLFTKLTLFKSLSELKIDPVTGNISSDTNPNLYHVIIHFPERLLRMSFAICAFLILGKYLYEIVLILSFNLKSIVFVLLKFISSCSIVYMYSLTISVLMRKLLRPCLHAFNNKLLTKPSNLTFKKTVSLSGILLFLIYLINNIVFEFYGNKTGSGNFLLMTSIPFLFFIAFLRNLISDHIENVTHVSNQMALIEQQDRNEVHKPIPVTTLDEVGMLTSSYNLVQQKIKKIYKEIDDDLDFAKNLHSQLIPPLLFQNQRITCWGLSKPVRQIGGDFYDIISINENKVVVFIGDVLGKGLPASLLMSTFIGHFRAKGSQITSPKHFIEDLNRTMYPLTKDGFFVTCGVALLDFEANRFTYVSAGHLPPAIVREDGASYLESSSFPIGVNEQIKLIQLEIPLEDIKQIVIYTDGIIEQENNQGECFGYAQLRELLHSGKQTPESILGEVTRFAGEAPLHDDMSVVAISLRPIINTNKSHKNL